MHRAWMVLLAACGFHSPAPTASDAMLPCWAISDAAFQVSACATTLAAPIDVTVNVSLDTDTGVSNPAGLTCAELAHDSENVCALAASTIKLEPGVRLSAHGTRPLALLGHSIDIGGAIDVASHIGGQQGPASDLSGCNAGARATRNGGGQGGTYDAPLGGEGGAGNVGTGGGAGAGTIAITMRGGCPGGPSSGGTAAIGGHGGGAVWLAVDTGMLLLGDGAIINASGASGAGGMAISDDRGGYGGGSGGLIALQAPMITRAPSARIFANGGAGGGGAGDGAGSPGVDPDGPTSGGSGGRPGLRGGAGSPASGGPGFPATLRDGGAGVGNEQDGNGGGGGGGGAGAIRVASVTDLGGTNVSPPLVMLQS